MNTSEIRQRLEENLKNTKDKGIREERNDNLIDIIENNEIVTKITTNPYHIQSLIYKATIVLRIFKYEEQDKILSHSFEYCNQFNRLVDDKTIQNRYRLKEETLLKKKGFVYYSQAELAELIFERKKENKKAPNHWIYEWIDAAKKSVLNFELVESKYKNNEYKRNNVMAHFRYGDGIAKALQEHEPATEELINEAENSLKEFMYYYTNINTNTNKKGAVLKYMSRKAEKDLDYLERKFL